MASVETATQPEEAGLPAGPVPFGKPMRALFNFAEGHHPLNHGSYGTYPDAVRRVRDQRLRDHEARPDLYKRFVHPGLLDKARAALLPLLAPAVHVDEVVLVPNATTGVNAVLHNLSARWSAADGDAVLYFRTMYAGCHKTLLALAETGRLHPVEVPVVYPDDGDDAVLDKLRAAHGAAVARGLRPRLVVFDTVVSIPGVRMPWERLTALCRDELRVLSLIDGAHAVGLIDLTSLGGPDAQPDFFVSNCHKWLFVPRGCAMLYVPFRNQALLTTSLPTSHGYQPDLAQRHVLAAVPGQSAAIPTGPAPVSATGAALSSNYFTALFADVGTLDYSPFLCIPEALAFRRDVCGGEQAIRDYCFRLSVDGADLTARVLGTEVMDHPASRMRESALSMVRLPLSVVPDDQADAHPDAIPHSRALDVWVWLQHRLAEYDTYLYVTFYEARFWVRLSAQIYLDLDDFQWGADTLLALCNRTKKGEWKQT